MNTSPSPQAPVRVIQIVVAALAAGVVMLTTVFVVVRSMQDGPQVSDLETPLLVALGALAVGEIPVYMLIRGRFLKQLGEGVEAASEGLAAGFLPRELVTVTIIGAALAEAIGLFGAVTYFLTGSPVALAAPVLATLVILAQLPTRHRTENILRDLGRGSY